jgi:hypothetical protein
MCHRCSISEQCVRSLNKRLHCEYNVENFMVISSPCIMVLDIHNALLKVNIHNTVKDSVQSTVHQTIHFGLCTVIIPTAL